MKNIFDSHYKKYDMWYEKHKFAYLSELSAIKKELPETGKGLEIGVGTGRFAEPLGIRYGVDPSPNMVKMAKKRGILARAGRGENLPFADNSFDYVLINVTICFVKDPTKVLKEAGRVLKRKGRITVGIVDKNSSLGKFYLRKKSLFYANARFFSVKELSSLLKTAGFTKLAYRQTIFNFPEKMKAVEKSEKGSGKGSFVLISAEKR